MKSRTIYMSLLLFFVSGELSLLGAAEQPSGIPFRLYAGFAIVVRGAIGGQENLNFLVDTGAVPSVIHLRLARKLNLNGPREDLSVISHSQPVERLMIPPMRLGLLEVPSVSAVVVDLSAIEKRLGLRLDAIIGLDVLGRQDFTIDYRLHQILIGAAATTQEAVPFELLTQADATYIVVRMETNSQFVRLLMDTGADGITLFAARIKGRLLARQKSARMDVSASGEYAVEQIQLLDVRLGTTKRGKRQATLLETAPASQDFDGILGPRSLGITRLAFDFRAKILYLQIER